MTATPDWQAPHSDATAGSLRLIGIRTDHLPGP